MTILALDTSFGACSAAILRADGECFSAYEEMERGHAEALIPMVGAVMRDAGIAFGDIDRVAATTGPGSFTGVRIAISAALGLVIACGAQSFGVMSLAVMARRAQHDGLWRETDGPLAICVDARRDEVYAAMFGMGDEFETPCVLSLADALQLVPQGAAIAGTGAVRVVEVTGRNDLRKIAPNLQPHAAALADLVASGKVPPGPLRPLYLRAPDAKPQTGFVLRAP